MAIKGNRKCIQGRTLGYHEVVLNSQTRAMPFYARAGFAPEGEEYEEVGIPHRTMRRLM